MNCKVLGPEIFWEGIFELLFIILINPAEMQSNHVYSVFMRTSMSQKPSLKPIADLSVNAFDEWYLIIF